MFSLRLFSLAALAALAHGHSQIIAAYGDSGMSVGFQVEDLARNCTSISPCQQDATLIRDAEIQNNVANECGRTEIGGNIDVGENTENALAAGQVTKVQSGSTITMTIHQVNADGAGPYTCDMDPTGNSLGVTGQTALQVTNNVPGANGFSQAKTQDFNMTITLPANMNCTGGSTGNICTVRCRNNALAGPFGGCIAVQQTDTAAKTNVAADITTGSTLDEVNAQVQQNQIDLPAAIAANQAGGTPEQLAALAAVSKLAFPTVVSKAAPVQTPAADVVAAVNAAASTTTAAAAATTSDTTKKHKNKNN
ncbi:hypothetical protein M406DRAFT_291283 [Cryphonectria parasitica EP155]|uniref:GEgh 16 protein n=1 Tax=Cryphonectria parasitica (strain ATCC 38755 / EP155) TaxID=660469 RepID=A0A9P4Y0C9_CRYP1|nr:uncharacterized protein M406DRAFT_291283 [Cryphonectria parasitica EP155]KAF3764231.1 hypothetical protein M406DRAFT_291283 [Cryphonectria parasitica EP155]